MTTERLKTVFKNAVQNSKPLRVLFDQSARFSTGAYIAGDTILLLKQGINFNFDTLAGALYLAGAAALFQAKKDPFYIRLCGYGTMAGTFALAAGAYGKAGFAAALVGLAPVLFSGYMMTRTTGKTKADDGKELGFFKKYPTVTASLVFLGSRPFLIASAVQNGDLGMLAATLSWTGADAALGISDPNLQKAVNTNRKPQEAPVPKAA